MTAAPQSPVTASVPYGLWSLWDLVTTGMSGLAPLIYQLSMYQLMVQGRPDIEADELVAQATREDVRGWLKIASGVATDFEMTAAFHRVQEFGEAMEKKLTWRELGVQCRVLREAIEHGLKWQMIYRYNDEQGEVLKRWQTDWALVIIKFPSAVPDIRGAVDCWALNHWTASVFHSMRIVEYGLSALANDVGKALGINNWQNIIDQIESEIRSLGKTLPRGAEKNDRLKFLSEAAKEIVYFKDGWRNYVSHHRATYDRHQALSVLEHVRSFMNVLSQRLSEVPPWEELPV